MPHRESSAKTLNSWNKFGINFIQDIFYLFSVAVFHMFCIEENISLKIRTPSEENLLAGSVPMQPYCIPYVRSSCTSWGDLGPWQDTDVDIPTGYDVLHNTEPRMLFPIIDHTIVTMSVSMLNTYTL